MERKWWHDKIACQLYPKSYQDSDGDGIGDLKGIISRLDYLKKLGIDMVWLSPIYASPFVDQGYDISDYYKIAPEFGTMEDFEELVAGLKARDMHLIMDLVLNHCSDQHEWFQKALKDPYGPYGDYFYFRKGKNGKAPSNYRSYFGGSMWEPVPGWEDLYYYHSFAKEQPDLNWYNPAVTRELYQLVGRKRGRWIPDRCDHQYPEGSVLSGLRAGWSRWSVFCRRGGKSCLRYRRDAGGSEKAYLCPS